MYIVFLLAGVVVTWMAIGSVRTAPLSQTTSDLSAAHVVSGAFLHGQVSGRPAVLAGGVTTIRKEESYDIRRNHPCPAEGDGYDTDGAGGSCRHVTGSDQPYRAGTQESIPWDAGCAGCTSEMQCSRPAPCPGGGTA